MTTLYACVIHLTALENGTLLHNSGSYGHAAFLNLVRSVDPALSTALHNENQRKPFTVSPVRGIPASRGGVSLLRPGQEGWLRITILDERLFHVFIDRFLYGGARPTLNLGDNAFLVREISMTPSSHPLAGSATFETLQACLDEPAPQRLDFALDTPTAFSMGSNRFSTFPAPDLLFGSLARSWQAITGEDLGQVIIDYCRKALVVGRYHLETRAFSIKNKPQLGAEGKIQYVRMEGDDDPQPSGNAAASNELVAKSLNLLADLAFFTGVGRKTTQGMGQVRRILAQGHPGPLEEGDEYTRT